VHKGKLGEIRIVLKSSQHCISF